MYFFLNPHTNINIKHVDYKSLECEKKYLVVNIYSSFPFASRSTATSRF